MRFHIIISSLLLTVSAFAAEPEALERRALRAFAAGEWASAQALAGLVTDADPTDTGAHARLIGAAAMRGDSAAVPKAVERALGAGVPFGALTDSLQCSLRQAEGYALYPAILEDIASAMPYLRRPVAARLLDFYIRRRDGEKMVSYANILLAGRSDSPEYLDALAWGLLYCGSRDQAEATWRQALAADPGYAPAMIALASLLGYCDEAKSLLIKADSIAPSPAIKAHLTNLRP